MIPQTIQSVLDADRQQPQFMLAVGKKATREEMLARASANRGQPLTDDPSVVPPMNDKPFSYSVFNELMPPKK
ncbi:unnamed protein product [Didymodactylos carnosus]|uniref:Uncharacterized protein n=1 Tax=Didymodactylos carnosus TaxID=1234261 RepID=A0A813R968_9BILA|nr:unnamed protein product [Didymodactylos carnosus]CAF0858832.1 unnamed protein product [Didymodactylos carnosus]CAF3563350.1 unnamed protein product [Didymodactylos carnosus]CAF3643813.1 unnamed protein product [Didymodactylos carnosus]